MAQPQKNKKGNSLRENRRNILFRYGLIMGLILILSVKIIFNLVDNTVLSADKWNAKADSTLSFIDTIMPVRGDILAADGSVLATNMRVYTPCIDFCCPKFDETAYRKALPRLIDSMAYYFPRRTHDGWKQYLEAPLKKKASKRSRSYPVVRDVSFSEAQMLRKFPFFEGKRQFTGYHVNDRLKRVRPYGDMARRSIGEVGVDSVVTHPFGKYGLERSLNSLLAGSPGFSKKVALTKAIVDWTDMAPTNGYDVLTTIDINMQDMLETELNRVLDVCKPEWGTAVMLEVKTGDIKAIANLQRDPKTGKYIESLNYAVQRVEPGSVVKTFTMMNLMQDGKISVKDIHNNVHTGGRSATMCGFRVSDHLFTTDVPIDHILEYSSNVAISKLALQYYGDNPSQYYNVVKRSGILQPLNSGIAEETRPKFDSIQGARNWHRMQLMSQSFGYGTEISPLYTAAIYNGIANGGKFVRPRLVRGLRQQGVDSIFPVSYVNENMCSPEVATVLRDMLRKVVTGEHGTARKVVGTNERVKIAGKTGTARMHVPGEGYVQGKYRLAFCGFFPYDNPKYTCMVLIAYPTETWFNAESTSGRVVRAMAEGLFARGMLDNSSDYKADTKEVIGSQPTYYASLGNKPQRVNSSLMGGIPNSVMKRPGASAAGSVPNVLGLGLREALTLLETAGYNVTFSGSGFVAGQSPAGGSTARQGTKIQLLLKE